MAKILIVDDDEALSSMLASLLSAQKHVIEQVYDGETALERVFSYKYDLLIVDWRLPKTSGIEVCKHVKSKHPTLPVLMLTSNMRIEDKEQGLSAGADDYVTKPIETKEFTARVRALLRRTQAEQESKMLYKDIELDPASGRCKRKDRQISLAKKEAELLEALMLQPDSHLTTEALIIKLWGDDGSRAGLANCLKRLRIKLTEAGETDLIETLPGIGYRLK
jgi:DNA-binding response OmpR family regulator